MPRFSRLPSASIVRGSAEWVAFARHSFRHDGETMGAFQPGASWGLAFRVGARF